MAVVACFEQGAPPTMHLPPAVAHTVPGDEEDDEHAQRIPIRGRAKVQRMKSGYLAVGEVQSCTSCS